LAYDENNLNGAQILIFRWNLMQPIVSVVTVCRNNAGVIADCLQSVAAQRYPDIEHIVVDGASTDGTQGIVEAQLGTRGRLISEPDHGIYDAMNKGWRLATGDYVAFLNADDRYATQDVVGRMMEVAAQTDVDVVFGDVRFFRPEQKTRYVRRYRSGLFRPALLRWGLMPAHPAMFVRRSLIEKLGGFRQDMKIAADFDLCVRAFHSEQCTWQHVPLVVVEMATGGASTRDVAAKLTINREAVRACRDNGVYSNRLMIMGKYPFKLLELVNVD
jgi:glycosyltransferase involved in cell wall biosynthesis